MHSRSKLSHCDFHDAPFVTFSRLAKINYPIPPCQRSEAAEIKNCAWSG